MISTRDIFSVKEQNCDLEFWRDGLSAMRTMSNVFSRTTDYLKIFECICFDKNAFVKMYI